MRCSYSECNNKVDTKKLTQKSGSAPVVALNTSYCSEDCRKNAAYREYIELYQAGKLARSSSFPISSRVFGNSLVKEGKITPYQLEKAMDLKSMNGGHPLAFYLMKKGWVDRRDVLTTLARLHRVPYIVLGGRPQVSLLASRFPYGLLYVAGAIPFSYNRPVNRLCIAMKDPSDLSAYATFKSISGSEIQVFQGDPLEIDEYLAKIKTPGQASEFFSLEDGREAMAV